MRRLLQSFDRTYVINLRTRADRRAEMDAQLRRIGLNLRADNIQVFDAVRPQDPGGFPSIGARGCFLSHLGVLQDARRRGLSSVLILEDDANFDPGPHCAGVLDCLQRQDWGFFYGGYRVGALPPAQQACVRLQASQEVQATHCLAMRGQELIAALIDYMEAQLRRSPGDPRGGPMHVDGTYSWFRREHPEACTLLAVPPVARQRASRSDVDRPRFLDRAWGIRFVVGKLRSCKNALRQAVLKYGITAELKSMNEPKI